MCTSKHVHIITDTLKIADNKVSVTILYMFNMRNKVIGIVRHSQRFRCLTPGANTMSLMDAQGHLLNRMSSPPQLFFNIKILIGFPPLIQMPAGSPGLLPCHPPLQRCLFGHVSKHTCFYSQVLSSYDGGSFKVVITAFQFYIVQCVL